MGRTAIRIVVLALALLSLIVVALCAWGLYNAWTTNGDGSGLFILVAVPVGALALGVLVMCAKTINRLEAKEAAVVLAPARVQPDGTLEPNQQVVNKGGVSQSQSSTTISLWRTCARIPLVLALSVGVSALAWLAAWVLVDGRTSYDEFLVPLWIAVGAGVYTVPALALAFSKRTGMRTAAAVLALVLSAVTLFVFNRLDPGGGLISLGAIVYGAAALFTAAWPHP